MSPEVEDMFKYLCFKYFFTYSILKNQPFPRLHDSPVTSKDVSYFELFFWHEKQLSNFVKPLCRTGKSLEITYFFDVKFLGLTEKLSDRHWYQ